MMKFKSYIYVAVAVVVALAAVGIWYFSTQGGEPRDPGFDLLEKNKVGWDEYAKKCPMDALWFDLKGAGFQRGKIGCSANALDSVAHEGEDAIITITSKELATGVDEFRAWLKAHGLEEGPTLRVTYRHYPS